MLSQMEICFDNLTILIVGRAIKKWEKKFDKYIEGVVPGKNEPYKVSIGP